MVSARIGVEGATKQWITFENGPTRSKLLPVGVVSGKKYARFLRASFRGGFVTLSPVKLHPRHICWQAYFVALTELGHVATVDIFVFLVLGVVTKNLDAGWPERCVKREQHSNWPRYILQREIRGCINKVAPLDLWSLATRFLSRVRSDCFVARRLSRPDEKR